MLNVTSLSTLQRRKTITEIDDINNINKQKHKDDTNVFTDIMLHVLWVMKTFKQSLLSVANKWLMQFFSHLNVTSLVTVLLLQLRTTVYECVFSPFCAQELVLYSLSLFLSVS